MKKSITTAAAAALLAVGLFAAAPLAASAADSYTPTAPGGSITITPGGSSTVSFTGFQGSEIVDFSLTGENASGASLAILKLAVQTANLGSKAASPAGAVAATVTLPGNASGSYTLTATGEASGESATATLVVPAASGSGESGLADSGLDGGALLGLWVGGGALVLAGASIAVATTVRRNRQHTAA